MFGKPIFHWIQMHHRLKSAPPPHTRTQLDRSLGDMESGLSVRKTKTVVENQYPLNALVAKVCKTHAKEVWTRSNHKYFSSLHAFMVNVCFKYEVKCSAGRCKHNLSQFLVLKPQCQRGCRTEFNCPPCQIN